MRVRLSEEKWIKELNNITYSLYILLEEKQISNGNDKLNDYIEFLAKHTDISKPRLKKLLTYDIKKLITLTDVVDLSKALGVKPADLFRYDYDEKK